MSMHGTIASDASAAPHPSAYRVRRIETNPIIRPHMGLRVGHNVQGPSLIRVPEWVTNPLGRYYLYFADHKGDHIRLAFADHLEGPWRIHDAGALSLADSRYLTEAPAIPEGTTHARLVGTRPGMAPEHTPGVTPALSDATCPHIASPDVHVDHGQQRIMMYLHGLTGFQTQRTRLALSSDGLNFETREPLLGPSYFRAFQWQGMTYALAMPGRMLRSADGVSGFEPGPLVFDEPLQRHTAVRVRAPGELEVFWTRVGDVPERILVSRIALTSDWQQWRAGPPREVLRPELPWEGVDLPQAPSWRSGIDLPVHQLRDPALFEEDGRTWLLYAVQGESGIALAELIERPEAITPA
ncbi:MAG: hypothetical protein RLZ51_2588 [Pseudomonadota bacterium]|jgi:hypothetical protein